MATAGFVEWKAVVTSVITAIIVFLVLGLPSQALMVAWMTPWAEKRKRALERRNKPTYCRECRREPPAWFVHGGRCQYCAGTALRYPAPDESPDHFDREWKRLNDRRRREMARIGKILIGLPREDPATQTKPALRVADPAPEVEDPSEETSEETSAEEKRGEHKN